MFKRVFSVLLCLAVTSQGWPQQQPQQQGEQRQVEERIIAPQPGAGREIYVPGVTPFLWENHGGDPYFPVPDRAALVELSKKPGLREDLVAQGFTGEQAGYVMQQLATATGTTSEISEVILALDTPMRQMRFGHGVVPMVILKGKPEPAWQIILPTTLGSHVVWLPKICGNICLSPFPAQVERIETILKSEVREVQVQGPPGLQGPQGIPGPPGLGGEKDRGGSEEPRRVSKNGWVKWLLPVLIAGGVAAAVGATRGNGNGGTRIVIGPSPPSPGGGGPAPDPRN